MKRHQRHQKQGDRQDSGKALKIAISDKLAEFVKGCKTPDDLKKVLEIVQETKCMFNNPGSSGH